MPVSRAFAPRPARKSSSVSPEGGLSLVTDRIHAKYGSYLACKSCVSSERDRKGNYIKNAAGKRDGEGRYYRRWCCTSSGKFGCPTLSNAAYLDWAKTQLSRDLFRPIVEAVRGGFEDKSPEHCRLGLLLQDGPLPPIRSTSLKRKASTVQLSPPQTKRRLDFFRSRDIVAPTAEDPLSRKSIESCVTSSSPTLKAGKGNQIRSPPSSLFAELSNLRAKLDELIEEHGDNGVEDRREITLERNDETRGNSLSPEEYIGIHEARGLALRAAARPPTPPDRSPSPHPQPLSAVDRSESSPADPGASLLDVRRDLPPPVNLAAALAADFHSADASGKKDIRTRARRGNVVAAFEEELKWASCLRLLNASFDFLFLAETWFVGHARHIRDRRFVASTPLPPNSLQRTRNGGGLYLLASASARGRILGDVRATASAISFDIDGLAVSGIYLQPSMSCEDVTSTLRSVATSTVVMGDVNARLPWLETQSGRPGPPERVEALADFVRRHAFTALQPNGSSAASPSPGLPAKAVLAKSLTVDHCFVKMKRTASARLLLPETASVGLSTDHAYTLHLQLDISRSDAAGMRDCPASPVLRFHLGKLSDERVRKDMCAAFDDGVRSRGLLSASVVDPAALDRCLVSLVQSLCRRFLGQKKSSGAVAAVRKHIPAGRQDPAVSTLLYKSAAVESRENGVILPSGRGRSMGLSALQEITTSLGERYAGLPLRDNEPLQASNCPILSLRMRYFARDRQAGWEQGLRPGRRPYACDQSFTAVFLPGNPLPPVQPLSIDRE
ncbi:hypothetical protein Q7P37_009970 [Cladosporium fusiforme]